MRMRLAADSTTARFTGSIVFERDLMAKDALDERLRFNIDTVDAAGIGRELVQDASVGVLAGDAAKHVEGLGAGGHGRVSNSREGKPSFTGRAYAGSTS